jgi:transmembrane sensor
MMSVERFANYSAIQLATEAAFISWVKCPDADNNLFWSKYLRRYPEQSGQIEKARAIVLQMRVVQEVMDESRAVAVWDNISNQAKHLSAGKVVPGRFRPLYKWIAAAAILVFVVGGLWFIVGRDGAETPSIAVTPKMNDVAPGGDKAILTLADGTKVVLDTADNGAITKQGDVTVIKLNGQLAYNKGGAGATEVLYNTISTPRGGQYQLVLADGSKVWLNAASSLKFPTAFNGNDRVVELSGEGYFEVTHDANKPFHVKVNDMGVQVLGTHFNINSYSDEPAIKTTLLQGRVMVKKAEKLVYLNPGQQAVTQPGEDNIKVDYDVDTEEVVAWKNGRFRFNSANIEAILRQTARWYDVEVIYRGETNETFSGGLPRSENISQLLKILEATGKVGFTINGKQIIVQPK